MLDHAAVAARRPARRIRAWPGWQTVETGVVGIEILFLLEHRFERPTLDFAGVEQATAGTSFGTPHTRHVHTPLRRAWHRGLEVGVAIGSAGYGACLPV